MTQAVMALLLCASCSQALADWRPVNQDHSSATHYEVGAVRMIEGGIALVEYKRMTLQIGGSHLVVLDQFVASCREETRSLALLMKTHSSVHSDNGNQLRTLQSENFDPPKIVLTTDKASTDLATTVCAEVER